MPEFSSSDFAFSGRKHNNPPSHHGNPITGEGTEHFPPIAQQRFQKNYVSGRNKHTFAFTGSDQKRFQTSNVMSSHNDASNQGKWADELVKEHATKSDGASLQIKAVTAEISIIHATTDMNASRDPRLFKFSELRSFESRFNSFKLLDRKQLKLTTNSASTFKLPTSRLLSLALREQQPGQYKLTSSWQQTASTSSFTKPVESSVTEELPFLVEGTEYRDGVLILGITLS